MAATTSDRLPLLLVYGDEACERPDIECSLSLAEQVHEVLRSRGWAVTPVPIRSDARDELARYSPAEYLVVNLCEGQADQSFYYARVAQILEELGFTFTGSSAGALYATGSKLRTKDLLDQHGVPTPRWQRCSDPTNLRFSSFPAIVKPEWEHCSIGISGASVVSSLSEAQAQVSEVLARYRGDALIEEFLDSPEYIASLWEPAAGAGPIVLGIALISYSHLPDIRERLNTYDSKWNDETAAYQSTPAVCPAPLDPELQAAIERVATAGFRATGSRDYARIDLRLHGRQPMVLDVNTNCDLRRQGEGGFSHAARVAGFDHGEVIDHIVNLAQQRHPSRTSARAGS